MAAYTTLVLREMEKENSSGPGAGVPFSSVPFSCLSSVLISGSRHLGPEALYEYDLFAVINHEGQIDNGHYTNYARFEDEVCFSPSDLTPT